MKCTENCSVILNLIAMLKKCIYVCLMKKVHAKYFGNSFHFTRNLRVFLAQICMTFSCIYDNKLVSEFSEGEIQFAVFEVIAVSEIKKNRSAYCTCHLVHHSGSFVPVNILCILANFCIIIICHFAFVKEVINDSADQHLERSRRTYTCCCDNVCAYICIESCCLKAVLLCTFHHTCNECRCSLLVVCLAQFGKVYNDLISVSFTGDMDSLCSVRISRSDGIQVDASCNHLAAIVVCMVSNDLSSSC